MDPLPDWIESQLPAGRRDELVSVHGGESVHVSEWGPRDGRAVVLVHGNPTWGFLWRKVVAAIRARPGGDALRLIVPDLVGLGRSSKPDLATHTLAMHGVWLGDAIDRTALPSGSASREGSLALDHVAPGAPVVLVGQDWGGPIGLRAFADPARRARLRGIVLGNTAVGPPAATFEPTLFHRLAQLPFASDVLFRRLGFPLGVLHLSQGDRGSIRGDVARAYRWPLRTRRLREAPLALARMVPDSLHHASVRDLEITQELFVTAKVPVALVWGTKDPILGRVINHAARLRPDAVVVKTDAGHFLQEEVPEQLADAVMDVVARADWSPGARA